MLNKFEIHPDTKTTAWRFGYPNWCSHRLRFSRHDDRPEALLRFDFVASVQRNGRDCQTALIETCKVNMFTAITVFDRFMTMTSSLRPTAFDLVQHESSASYYVNDTDEARQAIGLWVGKQIINTVDPLKDSKYRVFADDVDDTFVAIDFGINDVEQVVKICAVAYQDGYTWDVYSNAVYFTHMAEEIEKVRKAICEWFIKYEHEYNAMSYRETMTRFIHDITNDVGSATGLNSCRMGYLPVDYDTYQLFLKEGVENQLMVNVEDASNQFDDELDPDADDFVKLTFIRRMLKKAHDDNLGDLVIYIA